MSWNTLNLYGMFIEHAGGLVYAGMWSEMIDDRKFHNPITAPDAAQAGSAQQNARAGRGRFGTAPRPWIPVGPADSITMDALHAFVGDHSPAIRLSPGEPRGIRQALPPLIKGKDYTGRIFVAGDPATRVSASLIWGAGAADRQTATISNLTPTFARFPFTFKCPADSTEGRIEITATGSGTLRTGAASLMPADNINGWRHEVVNVLKSLRSGVQTSGHDLSRLWRNLLIPMEQVDNCGKIQSE